MATKSERSGGVFLATNPIWPPAEYLSYRIVQVVNGSALTWWTILIPATKLYLEKQTHQLNLKKSLLADFSPKTAAMRPFWKIWRNFVFVIPYFFARNAMEPKSERFCNFVFPHFFKMAAAAMFFSRPRPQTIGVWCGWNAMAMQNFAAIGANLLQLSRQRWGHPRSPDGGHLEFQNGRRKFFEQNFLDLEGCLYFQANRIKSQGVIGLYFSAD